MLFGRIRGAEAFQMIGALPFALPDDVDMGEDTSSLFLQLTWWPSLDTWSTPGLGTSSSDPLFDKLGWNQWDATICGLPRSSNLAEGWHNGFKSIVNCTNPKIWSFMDALKLEHSLAELKIVKHLTRTSPLPQQKKWINNDHRLQKDVRSYDSYPILTYLF